MDNELAEILAFIKAIPPFDQLPTDVAEKLVKTIVVCYLPKNNQLPPANVSDKRLYLVRKGALVYQSEDAELLGKYGEGDICTVFCFPDHHQNIKVTTDEDTLLYSIPEQKISALIDSHPDVVDFLQHSAAQRLSKKMTLIAEDAIMNSTLSNTSVADFYHFPIETINATQSIQQAAIKMTEKGFSCLVVVNNDQHVGIITDKDLRSRCIASGLDINTPVGEIMTSEMATIDIKGNAFDALTTMTARQIHHLPVTRHNNVVGMLTSTDLMNNEGHNAINISNIIHKAESLEELTIISRLLPKLQIRMTRLGTTADHVAKNFSAITTALTIRLIKMAEKKLGEAPVHYAWVAAGSQARQEQLFHSDQDNALIISDDMEPKDAEWFAQLAQFVCDGLNACGFVYCPGNVMASNNKWRKTQSQWNNYFQQWIHAPDPRALMHSSIFFDLETVYGNSTMLEQVRQKMLRQTKKNSLFVAHLTKNALQLRPPLGFFRDFVLISSGEHKDTLDIKHNGIAPIVDLARIYALQQGISSVNTIERLRQVAGTDSLTRSSANNLIDAFEFLMQLKMEHQSRRLQEGLKPDNYLSLAEISRLEREHLKDAFKVIKTMQDSRQSVY